VLKEEARKCSVTHASPQLKSFETFSVDNFIKISTQAPVCWYHINMKKRSAKAVVFNLFHAATHFANQFNLMTPSENFQSGLCNAVVFPQ